MTAYTSSGSAALADYFRKRADVLRTLDPDAPLDDLEPLREIVGDARVVAVGEGAHFVHEFGLAHARVLRFLAERCGFTVLAMEFGFSEGFALDSWLSGGGAESDLAELSGALSLGLAGELLRWLRRYNRTGSRPVRFVGVDIPTSVAIHHDLVPVSDYLSVVDPDALPTLETARGIADRIASGSAVVGALSWFEHEPAEQDALTASLARLLLRMRALEPLYVSRSDQNSYDLALRQMEAACHTDYMYKAMHGIFSGNHVPGDTSVRDRYMADSLSWHLDRLEPGTRVVLVAHTNHIQKTPVSFGDITALPMGHHLDRMLGEDYCALALTHTSDTVPEMHFPDETSEVGFTVAPVNVATPEPGSVEAGLIDAGLGGDITLTNLRDAPRDATASVALNSIRTQSAAMVTPVPEAFDAVLSSPVANMDETVKF
ncbi:hypothetical protein GCM10012275_31330 [Longimycelium tulufanense]|uniref:Erythromycin esterase n=1 Tax=Longimycelium tulufanense TaxID=907463 RepID=A0A8J3FX08_9PSEU|nr:erythromycin esterase family protein [Longimycelium tulufanense]GGM57854.1 hypothetical protein GCM10012275_31330 [Longimycelium tulufanense]